MKGIVFTEFLGMVDDTFGPVVTDSVVSDVDPPSGGVYMTLGTYSCELEENVAARLLELGKQQGARVITSQTTLELAQDYGLEARVSKRDFVTLRGRSEPVGVCVLEA